MKKRLLMIILSLGLVFTMFLTSGCGGPKTLEEYIESDKDAKETIDSMTTDQMKVNISGNTLTYTYTYDQTFEGEHLELMKEELEKAMEKQSSTFESIGETLEKNSGIDDVEVKVIYKDKQGTEIFSEDY